MTLAPLVALLLSVGGAFVAMGTWQTTQVRLECTRGAEPVLSCDYACSRAFGLFAERRRITGVTRIGRAQVPFGRYSSRSALALWNRDEPLETVVGDPHSVESALAGLEQLVAGPDTRRAVTVEAGSTFQLVLGGFILMLGLLAWIERDAGRRRERTGADTPSADP